MTRVVTAIGVRTRNMTKACGVTLTGRGCTNRYRE